MLSNLYYVFIFVLLVRCGFSQLSVVNTGCTEVDVDKEALKANIGWPFIIPCNLFRTGEEYSIYDINYYDEENYYVCEIWSENDTLLFNMTTSYESLDKNFGLEIDEVQENSSLNYSMTLWSKTQQKCLSAKIRLELQPFKQITCEEFVRDFKYTYAADMVDDFKRLSCEVSYYKYPKVIDNKEQTFKWQRNCSTLPEDVRVDSENKLIISGITFDHAGLYTCSVTYKGMTRYLIKRDICVTHPSSSNQHSLVCETLVTKKEEGRDVVFSCNGIYGNGGHSGRILKFRWKKLLQSGNFSEYSTCDKDKQDGRISCKYIQEPVTCYNHIASNEERKNMQAAFPVFLTIRNITSVDYGTYLLDFEVNSDIPSVNVTLVLERNPLPALITTSAIAGICVGVFCFVLILMAIIIYNMLYFRVYFKRYYGSYVADDKKYGAFLCYNFSNNIDTFAKGDVKNSIFMIRKVLDELGYKIYDERKDGFSLESRAENIQQSIEKSHRVVILLSLDFIKDGWSMLSLHTGFDKMIKSQSRLIFVLLPGITEYLKQHQNHDEACLMIKTAVKLNYAIPWSGKKNFSKKLFRLRMEDAMPKLRSQKLARAVSTSSSGEGSLSNYVDYNNHNFQRCFSNETDITDIESPKSIGEINLNFNEDQDGFNDTVL